MRYWYTAHVTDFKGVGSAGVHVPILLSRVEAFTALELIILSCFLSLRLKEDRVLALTSRLTKREHKE